MINEPERKIPEEFREAVELLDWRERVGDLVGLTEHFYADSLGNKKVLTELNRDMRIHGSVKINLGTTAGPIPWLLWKFFNSKGYSSLINLENGHGYQNYFLYIRRRGFFERTFRGRRVA